MSNEIEFSFLKQNLKLNEKNIIRIKIFIKSNQSNANSALKKL